VSAFPQRGGLRFVAVCAGNVLEWQALTIYQLMQAGASLQTVARLPDNDSALAAFARRFGLVSHMQANRSSIVPTDCSDADLPAMFASQRPDFVLSFQPLALSWRDLPYGVWYLSLSDLQRFSTAVPGFWEIYYGDDVTAATLVRNDEQGATVLKTAFLATLPYSLQDSVERLCATAVTLPAQICAEIAQGIADLQGQRMTKPATHYGYPAQSELRRFDEIVSRNKRARESRARRFRIDWNIALIAQNPAALIGGHRPEPMQILCKTTDDQYFADPFVFERDNEPLVFCERYSYSTDKGSIAVFPLPKNQLAKPVVVIDEPYHLSYPQVFEADGTIWCMPESSAVRELSLYRAIEFPLRWEKAHTLLDDFAAVDATLLRAPDGWWIFCTNEDEGYNSHLYVFFADALLGPWQPHPKNPVKIDVRSAGSAGPCIQLDGAIYRPAQDCSHTYGGLIRINKLCVLTRADYREEVVAAVGPPNGAYREGIHAISGFDSRSVVDVKRYVLSARVVTRSLRATLGKTARKFGLLGGAGRSADHQIRQ